MRASGNVSLERLTYASKKIGLVIASRFLLGSLLSLNTEDTRFGYRRGDVLGFLGLWRTFNKKTLLGAWIVALAASVSIHADEVNYSKDIEPFLRRNCLACHHSKKPEGGLSLESPGEFTKGGDSGPLVIAGNASESLLVQRVMGTTDSIMPPEGNAVAASHLNSDQVEILSRWINAGARFDPVTDSKERMLRGSSSDAELNSSVKFSYGMGVIAKKNIVVFSRGNDLYMDWTAKGSNPQLLLANAHGGLIHTMIVSPDGSWLATSSHDELVVWGIEFSQFDADEDSIPKIVLREKLTPASFEKDGFRWTEDRISSLAASSDGRLLAIGSGQPSRSGTVSVLEVDSPKAAIRMLLPEIHTDSVSSLAFSPDGRTLATGSADKMIKLIRIESNDGATENFEIIATSSTSRVVKNFEGHTGYVLGLDWNRDGSRLASVGADGTLRIWDINLGESSQTIAVENELSAVHFCDDHRPLIAGTSIDGYLRIFDFDRGEIVRSLAVSSEIDPQYCLSPTSNPLHVLTTGESGVVRMWNIEDGNRLMESAE